MCYGQVTLALKYLHMYIVDFALLLDYNQSLTTVHVHVHERVDSLVLYRSDPGLIPNHGGVMARENFQLCFTHVKAIVSV